MNDAGRVFKAAERCFAPWKNGGGETAEVICVPAGADWDGFDWRISTARVAASGPYSVLPGVERVLTVVAGGALDLTLPGGEVHHLSPGAAPLRFAGDLPCNCTLIGADVLNLNVMTRAPFHATVRRGDSPAAGEKPLARYAFATRAIPAMGLDRHDLMELMTSPARDAGLWIIEIHHDAAEPKAD